MSDLNFFLYSVLYFTIKRTIGILVRSPRPNIKISQHNQLHLSNPSIFVHHWIQIVFIFAAIYFLFFTFLKFISCSLHSCTLNLCSLLSCNLDLCSLLSCTLSFVAILFTTFYISALHIKKIIKRSITRNVWI